MTACQQCGGALRADVTACPQCGRTVKPAVSRHRILTIMFVDLVGSMKLAQELELDDYDAMLGRFHEAVADLIASYGGLLLQHYGDGAMGCFGLQHDGEDAALAGLACGLSLVERVPARLSGLQVRVGLHSGKVMCHGEDTRALVPQITGYHASLAARLQQIAPPGAVVISEQAAHFISRLASIDVVGARDVMLSGINRPVGTFEVRGYRFLHAPGNSPLLDREHVLARVMGDDASWPDCPAFLIMGEMGLGKTSLLDRLAESADSQIRMSARANLARTPFFPVLECLIHELFDGVVPKAGECEEFFAGQNFPAIPGDSNTFQAMVGLPVDQLPNLTPEGQRQNRIDLVTRLLIFLMDRSAAHLAFDDVQWADPDSLAVMEAIIAQRRFPAGRVVLAARPYPEIRALADRHGIEIVELQPLSDDAAWRLVARSGADLSLQLREKILAKAEGNPLFISVLSQHLAQLADATDEAVILPETIEAAYQAMIERFDDEKALIFAASILGRTFLRDHLALLVPEDVRTRDQFDHLVRSGIFTVMPGGFAFSHILLRDAAYSMIPPSRRRMFHRQVFTALSDEHPAFAQAYPELLAEHALSSGDPTAIIPACINAGRHLLQAAHFDPALGYFQHALAQMPHEHAGENHRARLSTLALFTSTQVQRLGFAHPDVLASYRQLEAETESGGGGTLEQMLVRYGIVSHAMIGARLHDCARMVDQMGVLAAGQGPVHDMLYEVHRAAHALYSGQFALCEEACGRVDALYSPERDALLFLEIGADPLASILSARAHVSARLYGIGRAHDALARAKDHLVAIGAITQLPWIHIFGSAALFFGGDRQSAVREVEAGIGLADSQSAAFWSLIGRMWLAVYKIHDGAHEEGMTLLEPLLDQAAAVGAAINRPIFLASLSHASLETGNVRRAEDLWVRAASLIDESGEAMFAEQVFALHPRTAARMPANESQKVIK